MTRPLVIWLTGGATAADRPGLEWWKEPAADGWAIASIQTDPARASYSRDGLSIDLASSAVWYGPEHSAPRCARAHLDLTRELRRVFDRKCALLGSPARTGLDLLQRSLPFTARPRDPERMVVRYPALADELADTIRHNCGQGRMEFFKPAGTQIDGLYVFDSRWQYAACVRHLPAGPAVHDYEQDFAGYVPGFYRVDAHIPDDWAHVGILPMYDAEANRTVWPRTPGLVLRNCWCSGAELGAALGPLANWTVSIKERILWPQYNVSPGADPAQKWITRLRALRAEAAGDELVSAAIRNLAIHPIGLWARTTRNTRMITPDGQQADIPTEALDVHWEPDGWHWVRPAGLDEHTRAFMRPEWSGTVWGRSRAKWVTRALTVPFASVVAARTDAAALSFHPGWHDTGQVGAWRVKRAIRQPLTAPHDETSWRKLWASSAYDEKGK